MASNDPRRSGRSGDPRKQGNDGAAAGPVSVPAFSGGQPAPNGQAALTGQPARIAQAVAQALAETLPNLLAGAFYQVLLQTPVRVAQLPCYECKLGRLNWVHAHNAELTAAEKTWRAALAEIPEDDPRRGMLSPMTFLPPDLQQSPDPATPNPKAIPGISDGETMVGGTLYCTAHLPGAPAQVSKRPYLIAGGHMSPAMLTELAKV